METDKEKLLDPLNKKSMISCSTVKSKDVVINYSNDYRNSNDINDELKNVHKIHMINYFDSETGTMKKLLIKRVKNK